jgi:hypothetical protein
MRSLETKIKQDAMTYSKEWFGKTITSSEVMDEKFNVMLRHPKVKGSQEPDLSKSPTMTVKIPCWNGVWKSEIYDEDGNPLFVTGKVNSHLTPLEFIKPKSHIIVLIQCGGLWFINGKVSITWNLKQAIVQKPKDSMEGKCLLNLRTHDKEKLRSLPQPEDVDPDGGVVSAVVDDSDDEEEEEQAYVQPAKLSLAPVIHPEVEAEVEVEVEVEAEQEVAVAAPVPQVVEEPKKKRIVTKKKDA